MGKAMRPAVVLWSAGAAGGDDRVEAALPAAAAIEVFHTYTIVHDDIIDRDSIRRGGPSVHAQFEQVAQEVFNLRGEEASHYGLSIGLLAGDTQLCWSVSILTDYLTNAAVSPAVAQYVIKQVTDELFPAVPSGELLDINFALTDPDSLTAQQILDMYYRKTGVTFEVAARIGAAIGQNSLDDHAGTLRNLGEFARLSGLAFQLYDDILGIVGNPKDTKKPVGADIHEGKRTFTVIDACEHVEPAVRIRLLQTLNNRHVTEAEVVEAVQILEDSGAITRTRTAARGYLEQARAHLEQLPNSDYRRLLDTWATYVIERLG
jgi:geranylgeranyl diphosphate synthase type I